MHNLTKDEKRVLIFLLFLALLGTIITYYGKISKKPNFNISRHLNQYKQPLVVNINIASKEELASLDGIGPVLASRIIEYRRKYGRFSSIEDLGKVNGIGPAKLEIIKSVIKIE